MMHAWLSHCLLVAQENGVAEVASRMGESFRQSGDGIAAAKIIQVLVVVLAILGIMAILARSSARQGNRPAYHSPWRLFWSLCRAHRLRWFDVWLLRSLAIEQRLADPARLFLEPERLDPAVLAGQMRKHASRLEQLKATLFSGLAS